MRNLIGRQLGHYLLERRLGEGGMGTVYQARQLSLNRTVAVKVLEFLGDDEASRRFRREAEAVARLERHPYIVSIIDYGVEDDYNFVVMPLLTGGTLTDYLKKRKYLPPLETAVILDKLASALDYAHAHGIVHRDIKPPNIMFDELGNPQIVDFGIAKFVATEMSVLTQTGTFVGTPAYTAPEQWRSNDGITPATDQYALGIVVYQMLTGDLPFEGNTPQRLMFQHLTEAPIPLIDYGGEFSQALSDVVLKTMNKEPSERYESVGAFARAFREVLNIKDTDQLPEIIIDVNAGAPSDIGIEPSQVVTESMPSTIFRRRSWLGVGVIGLLAIVVGIALMLGSGSINNDATDTPPSESSMVAVGVPETMLPTEAPTEAPPTIQRVSQSTQPTVISANGLASPTSTDQPTATTTDRPTQTPTVEITSTASNTLTHSPTPKPSETPSDTPTRTPNTTATATHTARATQTDTEAPTTTNTATNRPTATRTSRPTHTPSDTPTMTATMTATMDAPQIITSGVINGRTVNTRIGPGTDYPVAIQFSEGDRVGIIGQIERNSQTWYWISMLPDDSGETPAADTTLWVAGFLLDIDEDFDLSEIPEILSADIPDTPTAGAVINASGDSGGSSLPSGGTEVCSQQSYLSIGDNAYTLSKLGLQARDRLGTWSTVVAANVTINILDGPVCAQIGNSLCVYWNIYADPGESLLPIPSTNPDLADRTDPNPVAVDGWVIESCLVDGVQTRYMTPAQ